MRKWLFHLDVICTEPLCNAAPIYTILRVYIKYIFPMYILHCCYVLLRDYSSLFLHDSKCKVPWNSPGPFSFINKCNTFVSNISLLVTTTSLGTGNTTKNVSCIVNKYSVDDRYYTHTTAYPSGAELPTTWCLDTSMAFPFSSLTKRSNPEMVSNR